MSLNDLLDDIKLETHMDLTKVEEAKLKDALRRALVKAYDDGYTDGEINAKADYEGEGW